MFNTLPAGPNWMERLKPLRPTLRYCLETEVHVYAFSMAANILLSFFPFFIVMISLCRYVLEWRAAEAAIYLALSDYFPDPMGEFIRRNLRFTVASRGPFQVGSVLVLLFTANGIFEPLEVALNRAWGITKNRSYFKNQLVSLGLILVCGGLALTSSILTAVNLELWNRAGTWMQGLAQYYSLAFFRMAAVPLSILLLFLIYWLLPNARIPWRAVAPPAIVVGVALEFLKYLNLWTWPWLRAKLEHEVGPFVYSVTIVLWGFLSSMVVLAGAEWAARPRCNPPAESIDSRGNLDPGCIRLHHKEGNGDAKQQ